MFEDIKKYFEENKVPKMRSYQLEDSVFKLSRITFNELIQFPKALRENLEKKFGSLLSLSHVRTHESDDTIKFVLKTRDNNFIEVILMMHGSTRRTVCVSSQIFCALGCKFCATGANKFQRNLTSDEIVSQVLFVNNYLKKEEQTKVTNVVYMGMGEPFLNYDNVIESINILNDKVGIGARHITVSTAGIVPKINEFTKLNKQIRLAISLHAANDKLRSKLMPINDKYPLKELIKATDNFVKLKNKRISYEYVLIKDINDSTKHAQELVNLLKGKLAHVNLLIYNPHEFSDFKKPDFENVRMFKQMLESNKIEVSIRKSMGDELAGACGQLSAKEQK